nr:transposase [Pseudomonas sp. PDM25]
MHTGQLEGINNRIEVIKRMAYGYRDSEFFS